MGEGLPLHREFYTVGTQQVLQQKKIAEPKKLVPTLVVLPVPVYDRTRYRYTTTYLLLASGRLVSLPG